MDNFQVIKQAAPNHNPRIIDKGYKFQCCCPAHEDRNPSLNVELKDDKIVMHCKARCDTKDVLAA